MSSETGEELLFSDDDRSLDGLIAPITPAGGAAAIVGTTGHPFMQKLSGVETKVVDNVLLSSARDIISRFVTGSSNVSKKLNNAKASTLPRHKQLVWALTDPS
eukprot:143857-Rhodomonas_salina.1